MTAVIETLSPIDEADRIIREAEETREQWPSSREARTLIAYAYGYAVEAVHTYTMLLHGDLDWDEVFTPDPGFGGDPESAAVEWAEGQAMDAARALERRIAEYKQREAASNGTEGGASS
jgi:hypothetical protein